MAAVIGVLSHVMGLIVMLFVFYEMVCLLKLQEALVYGTDVTDQLHSNDTHGQTPYSRLHSRAKSWVFSAITGEPLSGPALVQTWKVVVFVWQLANP